MLPRGLVRAGMRDLLRRPLQLILMVLGITLGVGVIIAIDLANQSANTAFRLSGEALSGRTTHQILGGPSGVSEDFYRELRVERGYTRSAPIVEGLAIALDLDGLPLRLLGIDPFAEAPFRDTLTSASLGSPGMERFFLDPNVVIMSKQLADRYDLSPGSPIRLQINDRVLTLEILALLDPGEEASIQGLEDVLFMDIAAAQEVFGSIGRLTRIDTILDDAQVESIQQFLPDNLLLKPASEQQTTLEQLTEAFQLNLQALSLLGLVVGMFLIYNATMFSVLQRRTIFGIFRTLGTTQRQIFFMILAEVSLIGVLGSVLGVGVGWILGRGAVQLVTQTINDLYFVLNVRTITLGSPTLIKAFSAGIGASVFAAVGPAWEAARVPEVVMLRRSKVERGVQRLMPLLGSFGVLLGLLGALVLVLERTSIVASFIGLFLILISLALFVPLCIQAFTVIMRPVLQYLFGPIGRMAAGTIYRSLSRTSVAVAALMVSLSVAIGVGIMIASFRSTVENWLDLTLQADIYISSPTYGGARPNANLDPRLGDELGTIEGVSEVETVRVALVQSNIGEVLLLIADTERERAADLYRYAVGDPEDLWERVQDGAVIVSEPFAFRNQIQSSGGEIVLRTDQGDKLFEIIGVYYDYTSEAGTVLMSRSTYTRYFSDPFISSIALHLDQDADYEEVLGSVRNELSGRGLEVRLNRALRTEALEIFDRTFLITSALRFLAIVVAFIGVISALLALQMERAREFATMQALGLRERGLWLLTSLETSMIGLLSGLLAIPTGTILAVVLVYVINLRSFGWTIQMEPDPVIFLGAVFTSILAALLAGIYPALSLIRQPIARSLSRE